jgi:metal-sulfur cluster biosynthetic enzyme
MANDTDLGRAGGVTQEKVLGLLSAVKDPEVGINIVDLGLVSWVKVTETAVEVEFTLTYPGCPLGPTIEEQIVRAVKDGTGIGEVRARIVWEPPWSEERMSEAARLELGYPI